MAIAEDRSGAMWIGLRENLRLFRYKDGRFAPIDHAPGKTQGAVRALHLDPPTATAARGRYGSMEEALAKIGRALPDVVQSDIGLPGMDGIAGIRVLKERHPELIILVLSVYDDERIFDTPCAGATGYLLKKTPPARLLDSLKEAVTGGSPMSPEVARRVISLFREVRPPARANYELTPHETRLLKLLVEGYDYKTAASELNVSVNTIAFHKKRVYEKLQVHSKSEAVAKALRHGLTR